MGGVLKLVLGAYMVSAIVNVWATWQVVTWLLRGLSGEEISDGYSEWILHLLMRTWIGGAVVTLVTAVLFLRWTALATRNAHALSGGTTRYRPAWAVGSYFVPIANLWVPYRAMRETFRVSNPGRGDYGRPAPQTRLVGAWWSLWLLVGVLGQFLPYVLLQLVPKLVFGRTPPELFLVHSLTRLGASGLAVVLALVTIAMVSRLHQWQSQAIQRTAPKTVFD